LKCLARAIGNGGRAKIRVMSVPDDNSTRPSVARTTKHQDELNKLGRSWFAEVREQSEHEEAEVEAWRREHNKWAAFNRRFPGIEPDFE
jgi:hypothetical protein